MLGRWDTGSMVQWEDGRNNSSTKRMTFQALFFSYFLIVLGSHLYTQFFVHLHVSGENLIGKVFDSPIDANFCLN